MNYRKILLLSAFLFIALFSASSQEQIGSPLVYQISIRNEIGNGIRVYIDNGIDRAEEANAELIVFDIDTPGGAVNAARDIIDSIQRTKIPTIAYVNTWAISAGAMISLACDGIAMRRGGSIGDSAPVSVQGKEAGEKIVSAIRGTIKSIAERQGRNPDIAAAMVDKELVLVKLKKSGKILALRAQEYNERRENGEKMELICAEGELLTLTADEAIKYEIADTLAEDVKELLATYLLVEVDEKRKLMIRSDFESEEKRLGEHRIKKIKSFRYGTIHDVSVTLADRIVFFITNPLISSLLLSLGTLGLFIEMRSPGFGFPGLMGLVCLGLFFGGHMLSQIEAEYAALAFVVGIGLLMLEVFVIPGFGIAGTSGIMLILGSVFFVFRNAYQPDEAIFWLTVSVLSTFGFGILTAYMLPKTNAWQKFILQTEIGSNIGYHSAGDGGLDNYIGMTGRSLSQLRPAGIARIEGNRLDVLSVGEFIENDTAIKVSKVEGSKVFVERND